MAKKREIDVYREWLGITDETRPLDYYTLLRLKKFEDDVQVIRRNYRKLNAHVRKYATGDYADESQQLLNELARAMLCLTDAQRKREYDATLGRKVEEPWRRRTLEEILLANKVATPEQIEKARRFADAVGIEMRDAVVQQKLAEPEVVMQAYAESVGMPYIDLRETQIDTELIPKIPARVAKQHSCIPVMIDDGQLLVASPNPINPETEEELRLRYDMPVRSVLCTPASINLALQHYFSQHSQQEQASPAASHSTAASAPRAARPTSTLSAEEASKLGIKYGLVGFNFTVMALMVVQYLLHVPGSLGEVFGMFVRAVIPAVLVGGGIYGYYFWKQ
ncbi:hypothetical protein JCM19992_23950 [Thermostilla marina]